MSDLDDNGERPPTLFEGLEKAQEISERDIKRAARELSTPHVGAGPIGPSLGEVVRMEMFGVTGDPRGGDVFGEVVEVDYAREYFTVQLEHSRDRRLAEASSEPFTFSGPRVRFALHNYGTRIHCAWDCGHSTHSVCCYLRQRHHGPHLYKLR